MGNRFLLALAIVLLCSCSAQQYIPVETVRYDSIYLSKILKDSIFVRDSVFLMEKGDTVFQTNTKYVYKFKSITDTVFIERIDTIRVPYPVEKKLTWWEKKKMDWGTFSMFGWGGVMAVGLISWLIRRTRKE